MSLPCRQGMLLSQQCAPTCGMLLWLGLSHMIVVCKARFRTLYAICRFCGYAYWCCCAASLQVDSGEELASGGEEEIEIRAASLLAVEQLKQASNKLLRARHEQDNSSSSSSSQPFQLLSIQLDWWLWQEGERMRSELPHHKTWSIFY